jgi:hypothetical protein
MYVICGHLCMCFLQVTKEEFIMYYSGVGTAFERDEECAAMLNNSWKQLRKEASTSMSGRKIMPDMIDVFAVLGNSGTWTRTL